MINKALSDPAVHCAAVRIPYFDVNGREINFFRTVELEPIKGAHFRHYYNIYRYRQKSDVPDRLYFPPVIDWAKVSADTSIDVRATDCELRAIKASRVGFPTICDPNLSVWEERDNPVTQADIDSFNFEGRDWWLDYDDAG